MNNRNRMETTITTTVQATRIMILHRKSLLIDRDGQRINQLVNSFIKYCKSAFQRRNMDNTHVC